MNDQALLYNSKIIKIFIEYITKYYPSVDIDSILEYSNLSLYEINDSGFWCNQEQVDRFYEIVVSKTGNSKIARDAGAYSVSSSAFGRVKQYMLGLISLSSIYLLMERFYPLLSRGASVKARRLGPNRVEITSVPKPGVNEKLYQCENRLGSFESLAKLFTAKLAKIDHTSCFHKGDECCRYDISWEGTPSLAWSRAVKMSIPISIFASFVSAFTLPIIPWFIFILACSLVNMILLWCSAVSQKTELERTIETQGNAAKDLLEELNIRHNNALFIQEIGQVTSTVLDERRLISTVVGIIQKRLDYDRGLIMLAKERDTRLFFCAGFGYTKDQEELLHQTEFHLDKADAKGIFVRAFKEKKPFLIENISDSGMELSARSSFLVKALGVKSLISVPIVCEGKPLGILAVDNLGNKKSFTQSDVNLLMGVAAQTAVSIANATSFQKIQESEKKYRDLVENANSIILRMDPAGKITFFNDYAQRFFGYSEKEILGARVQQTILPDLEAGFEKLINSLRRYPERQDVRETLNLLKNGQQVWIAWTFKPIFDEAGNFQEVLCIGNDISELKRAAREKEELEAQLQRAQKMEAIGTLAGGVAHDLNNILSGIVSYPELLLMQIPEGSHLRKPLTTIQKSGEKAAAIVQDLLTLARRGVAVTEVVNLNDILSEYLKSPEFEKLKFFHPDVALETDLEKNLLNILGSPVHLSKTMMNIISNAAEAMPNGGKIHVTTKNQYVDKPIKGYDDVDEGDYIIFRVTDEGVGIKAEDLERIFEPFYTKKVMGRSGTGLGMAVVWGTVKDHKGYIDVQSAVGAGSVFTLYFPVTRHGFTGTRSPVAFEHYQGRGEAILVVDDVEEQRDIATGMLKMLGYSAASVSSGADALQYLKEHPVELLILDMIMGPGLDGLETYRRVREIRPGQKAIIVSGFSESDRVKEAQRLGAGAYVKKPYLLEKLGIAVRSELDKTEHRSDN